MAARYSDDEELADGEDMGEKSSLKATLRKPVEMLVAALGGYEDELDEETGETVRVFRLGDECLACIKDLKKMWKLDEFDDNRTVARIFYETALLRKDLLPILQVTAHHEHGTTAHKVALATTDLVLAMTWPIDPVQELKDADLMAAEAEDPAARPKIDYKGLLAIQSSYKAAILRQNAIQTLFSITMPSLEKPKRDRRERDINIIAMILHIFRNLAALKDTVAGASLSTEALEQSSLQSELIIQLHASSVFDFLVTIASNADSTEFKSWTLVTLDLLHLIFRTVKPAELVSVTASISKGQDGLSELRSNKLADLLKAETHAKKTDNRKSNSRHSRFGTTMALETDGGKRYIMHKQSALVLSPSKILDEVKKGKKKKTRIEDDLAPAGSELKPDAVRCLAEVAVGFIDSAFNPFFASILHDIRRERTGIKEIDNIRFLVLSSFFLEYFLLLRQNEVKEGIAPDSEEGHDFDLIAEMTEASSIGYVCARMRGAMEEKPPMWTELHAAVNAFIQVLLTIEALTQSTNEEHREVADILQNKLYYEAETLSMVLEVVAKFKDQSKRYLDAIMNLTYVLLRMLERYSKNNEFMFVRKKKKRAAKRKRARRNKQIEDEGGPIDEASDDEEQDKESRQADFATHSFQFASFEATFATEAVLATCMTYLASYKTFTSEEQMKRIVSLMHRQAVRAKADGLFYKVSVLNLFKRMLDEKKSFPRQQPYQDLLKLIEFILKRFFKMAREKPLMLVEAFYPHRKGDIRKMMRGEDAFAESDKEERIVMPAEVEIREEWSETQKLGIAIALLSDRNEEFLLDWVKDALRLAAAQREEIVLSTDGAPVQETLMDIDNEEDANAIRTRMTERPPSEEAIAKFTSYEVPYTDDEQKKAGTKNSNFKLLLRVLLWESKEDFAEECLRWSIPASRLPKDLALDIKLIDNFLINPLDPGTGKSVADLVKKVVKRRPRKEAQEKLVSLSDAEKDGELDEDGEFVVKKKKGRRGKKVVSDGSDQEPELEGAKQRKKKRKQEAIQSFKSAQFIESDEDEINEERDAAFFAREQALRDKLDAAYAAGTGIASQGTKKKKDKKTSKKRKSAAAELDGDEDDAPASSSQPAKKAKKVKAKPSKRKQRSTSPAASPDRSAAASPMQQQSTPATTASSPQANDSQDIADPQFPPTATAKRRNIIADSDDD